MRDILFVWQVILRVVTLAGVFWAGWERESIGCFVWGGVESHLLLMALWNEWAAKARDRSVAGWGVPLLYSLGCLTAPVGVSGPGAEVLMMFTACIMLYTRLHLAESSTIAGSTWTSLKESGPYRVIRHPGLTAQAFDRLALTVAFPCWFNLVTVSCFMAAVVFIILLEERFLVQFAEYSAYTRRVKWRVLPGVW